MKSYEATGKTVAEAISEGLNTMGLSLAEVQVDILDEGSKGLFGLFGSKLARVRITAKETEESTDTAQLFPDSLDDYRAGRQVRKPQAKPRKEPAAKAEEAPKEKALKEEAAAPKRESRPKPEKKPQAQAPQEGEAPADEKKPGRGRRRKSSGRRARQKERPERQMPSEPPAPAEQKDPETDEGKVQGFLQEVTRLMEVPVSVHVRTDEEGNIRVTLEGDTLGILIGRRGETLDALQYLTSLNLNKGREGYTRVTLDSEGYRAKREDALIRLANRMANRAEKTGRRVRLEPMNPYERRVLHSALQDRPGVTTHSEGEEPNRHVVITLSKDRPEDDQSGENREEEPEDGR